MLDKSVPFHNYPSLLIFINSLSQIRLNGPENIVPIILAITFKVNRTIIISPIHDDIRILGTVFQENIPLLRAIFGDLGSDAFESCRYVGGCVLTGVNGIESEG